MPKAWLFPALGSNREIPAVLSLPIDSSSESAGDEEPREPGQQEKERGLGFLPVPRDVYELEEREQETAYSPENALLPGQDHDPEAAKEA
jgi:hypothetical protein